jgi:hypothetical protein
MNLWVIAAITLFVLVERSRTAQVGGERRPLIVLGLDGDRLAMTCCPEFPRLPVTRPS